MVKGREEITGFSRSYNNTPPNMDDALTTNDSYISTTNFTHSNTSTRSLNHFRHPRQSTASTIACSLSSSSADVHQRESQPFCRYKPNRLIRFLRNLCNKRAQRKRQEELDRDSKTFWSQSLSKTAQYK